MTEDDIDEVYKLLLNDPVQSNMTKLSEFHRFIHYTNFGTLKGILDSHRLWFSPISGMNDYREFEAGLELFDELIVTEDHPVRLQLHAALDISSELKEAFESIFNEERHQALENTFVSCWSGVSKEDASPDNLTMWRGYASDGNGVAISIDPVVLGVGLADSSDIIVLPVYYETRAEFDQRAQNLVSTFVTKLKHSVRTFPELMTTYSWLPAQSFRELLYLIALSHKHPGFRAENEVRFIFRRNFVSDESLLEHVMPQLTTSGLFEFFCFPLVDDANITPGRIALPEIVSEIMIGPCSDVMLKYRAIENLLARNGFEREKVKISASAIPYRSRR